MEERSQCSYSCWVWCFNLMLRPPFVILYIERSKTLLQRNPLIQYHIAFCTGSRTPFITIFATDTLNEMLPLPTVFYKYPTAVVHQRPTVSLILQNGL